MTKPLIFSTQDSHYLAKDIAELLEADLKEIIRKQFGGGEHYYRLDVASNTELFGHDVIFVGTTWHDEDIDELYRVGCALAGYGAKRRIFVIPFFGYATMERAQHPGEIVTAKTITRLLSAIPNHGNGNIFLLLDLHNSTLVHFFEGDCLRAELHAKELLIAAIAALNLDQLIFASADLGRPKWIRDLAKYFKTDTAFAQKDRDFEVTKLTHIIGNVRGKNVIIYDDMIRSGGTLLQAVDGYLAQGASSVSAAISHLAANSEDVIKQLIASPLETIITTNSHPQSQHPLVMSAEKFQIVDVSPIFARAIKQIIQPDS